MKKEIISNVIGRLKQDESFSDWWKSEEISIPFFNNEKLTITFTDFEINNDQNFIVEADQCLTNFLKLNINSRNLISELVYMNCMEFLDAIEFDEADEPLRNIKNKDEIWKFIHPTEIFIKRQYNKEQDIYLVIACECDWEQEHGLQLVFKQGKELTRISSQDGHLTETEAYNKSDNKDVVLFKFM